MHRLLYRYLFKELFSSFLVGLFIFTMVLLMKEVSRIVDLVVEKGAPLVDVLRLFVLLLPNFLILTLPTALLLGVLVTFSRIHADNELCALKTSGISLYRLLPPVYTFGVLVTGASLFLSTWAVPQSSRLVESMLYSVASKNIFVGLKERVFFDDFPGFVIYVERMDPEKNLIEGVFIADQNVPEIPVYYFAKQGRLYGDHEAGVLVLELQEGSLHRNDMGRGLYQVVEYDHFRIQLDLKAMLSPPERTKEQKRTRELGMREMRERIEKRAREGQDVTGLRVDYHLRYALPFGALVFCTLGVPFALVSHQSVRYTGFSLSIALILTYFVFLRVGSSLATAGGIPPVVGAWFSNVTLGLAGVYLLWQKAEERPSRILDAYAQFVQDAQVRVRSWFRTEES